jgi:hypothetical protein
VSDIDTAAADSLKVLDPKPPIREADIVRHGGNVRFVPKTDIGALLNHLVGGNEQVDRYIKAKCLGSLEIDSRLEPRRSLNW